MRSLVLALCAAACAIAQTFDISSFEVTRLWGQISPYHENVHSHFGVGIGGLPDGCQVEQAHLLQRHAQRFATEGPLDGENDVRFAEKVTKQQSKGGGFTGPLNFLNSWRIQIDESGLLTAEGAATEFKAGVNFWNNYGRILYNASSAQVTFDPKKNPIRRKPLLRTTNQSRIWNSQINWALGFFGSSFQEIPNPKIKGFSNLYDLVVIPEGGTENDTLAAYDSCFNDFKEDIGYIGDTNQANYLSKYLKPATTRMNKFAPAGFVFSVEDTYAMQSLCTYESAYLGVRHSTFCNLFNEEEWTGYEYTLELNYYFDYSFGQPTGRAQGIGYVQELLARLEKHYIKESDSSVNDTITDNPKDFPLNEPFYADFSHDDIIISALTAMSMDYFKDTPSLTKFPPDPNRRFVLSHITPFGARLVTEVIGCADSNPTPLSEDEAHRVQYYPTQYGYDATNAKYKFIRMRLNNGLLPLSTLRGGACENNRPDGMCAMGDFLKSQEKSYELSNYQYACFAKYKLPDPFNGQDWDGTISKDDVA